MKKNSNANDSSTLQTISSNSIGIGLRTPHHLQVLEEKPAISWLELHSENFFNPDSVRRHQLDLIAQDYALSFHGIGLSLGSTDRLNQQHLKQMKELIDCYQPAMISEHLSWSSKNGRYFNDLLPIPYTEESLALFCDRLNEVQDYLGRALLVENPTAYLSFAESTLTEWDFLNRIHDKTNCGLLLDLNNIYVNNINLGVSSKEYLESINISAVKEIHLAGFTRKELPEGDILIDTHGSPVSEPVWELFRYLRQFCYAPALIEWDTDIPELEVLLGEANRAEREQQSVFSNGERAIESC